MIHFNDCDSNVICSNLLYFKAVFMNIFTLKMGQMCDMTGVAYWDEPTMNYH